MKNIRKRPFAIVYLDLVEQGLCYEEAAIVRYVERFEKSKKPCFASIPYIARDLRMTDRSVRRHLKRLITQNFLTASGKGRGRYLTTNAAKMAGINAAKMATNSGQNVTDCGQNGRYDCGQNGRLSNSIMINNKIINNDQETTRVEMEDVMTKEEEEKKQARLKQLMAEVDGWEDKGSHYEKWDPETRTVLRKKKVSPTFRAWDSKINNGYLPD